jgi:hypothetical protein
MTSTLSPTLPAPTARLTAAASRAATPAAAARALPRPARWAGRVLSGVTCAGLAAGAAMGIAGAPAAIAGAVQLGYAPHLVPVLALVELACLLLYLVPRTAVLGAVLSTGYFGGAVATHLRLEQPLTQVLVPVYAAALLWAGLYLRDPRVRAMLRHAR